MRPGRARLRLSAVFLDRDGVINAKAPEGEYVTSWQAFRWLPGSLDALVRLSDLHVPTVVVTNQRGIARGQMSEDDLEDIHKRLSTTVRDAGGRLDQIYHCPHEGGCACRKPEVGMFMQAAAELGIDLARAVMIGDQPTDMLAGRRVGAMTIGVGGVAGQADHHEPDLPGVVRWLQGAGRVPPEPR